MALGSTVTETGLRAFFVEAVQVAASNQHVDAHRRTVEYVGDMLARFVHPEALYDKTDEGYGLTPLAELYAKAIDAPGARARADAYRRLGDVALFIAGLFSGSLNRKLVDVDYYIAMGRGAYGRVSATDACAAELPVREPVFGELSHKFAAFVDVLDEVGECSAGRRDHDLLRSYEIWLKTGSERAARKLERSGIIPIRTGGDHGSH